MKIFCPLLMRFSLLGFLFILIIPPPVKSEFSHTVKAGESLFSIGKKNHISVSQLQEANGLRDERIHPGQRLLIPAPPFKAETQPTMRKAAPPGAWKTEDPEIPETYIVKKKETLAEIARRTHLREEITEGTEVAPAQVKGFTFLLDEKDQQLLVRVAKSFLGIKYILGGSNLKGMDCSAFVQKVFGIFGVDLPRTAREQFQVGYRVAREALQIGDLVFFKRSKTPRPTHVGIYIGDGRFIHTSLRKQRVYIDSLDSGYFAAQFIGAKRIEEVWRPPETEKSTPHSAALPRE